jgi:hypothetical protein
MIHEYKYESKDSMESGKRERSFRFNHLYNPALWANLIKLSNFEELINKFSGESQ